MAALLYFFPRVTIDQLRAGQRLNQKLLETYGLGASLGDIRDAEREASLFFSPTAGPGGASGSFLAPLAPGRTTPRLGYYPDFQRWEKVLDESELWIGVDRESPPDPEDLARPRRIAGHRVELADGAEYEVPVIRSLRGTRLPQDLYHRADRQLALEVKPGYRELWEATAEVWDLFFDPAAPKELAFERILYHALAFLGVNYRYGDREQSVLHLIDTGNWQDVLFAAVDGPFYADAQKKTPDEHSPPAAANSPPGSPDASPDTAPAAVNSRSLRGNLPRES